MQHTDVDGGCLVASGLQQWVCIASNDKTMSQFHVLTMLGESFVNTLTIVLPFFPTGTMERVVVEGQVATANTLAKMFSHLPCGGQKNRLMLYDLHTLQNRFFFDLNTIATLHSAFPLIINKVRDMQRRAGTNEVAICFPDAGAEKRFAHYFHEAFPEIHTVVCGKKRDPDRPNRRIVKILDGDPSGKTCLIIDDLVQTGGTLTASAKALKSHGAESVSAFCTHAVFPSRAWRRFLKDGDRAIFDKFYVTNSNPVVTDELPTDDCFEVLDITELVVADLDD